MCEQINFNLKIIMKNLFTITSILFAGTLAANAVDGPYLEYYESEAGGSTPETEFFSSGDLTLYDGTYYDAKVQNANGCALSLSFYFSKVYGLTFVGSSGFENKFLLDGSRLGGSVKLANLKTASITASSLVSGTNISLENSKLILENLTWDISAENLNGVALVNLTGTNSSVQMMYVLALNFATEAALQSMVSKSLNLLSGTASVISNFSDLKITVAGIEVGDDYWAKQSSDGKTISIFSSVPEPSMFGLLAGLCALALVGARRRRRK